MTLIISFLAAIICTVLWYKDSPNSVWNIEILCWMFWGASLMWSVDMVFAYAEEGAGYFTPSAATMLNDTFLGVSVVVFALLIWVVSLMIKDPRGVILNRIENKRK